MLNELVRDVVKDAVAVIDDRREFERQAVLYDLWERVAVDGLRIVVAHLDQFLIRTCDFRVVGFPLFGEWL